ncbi:MAG: hypothetical protein A3G49_01965 [Candidatus Sungbacteria bacterium RIFCSPLOWO2_12_FULL_41_11]|uniref:Proline dehydrogenase domain-containing protein n=1 Tax=Candidatus Sungbacteria bacterium RIFCSPLOWO2_12_FULL_41_11 TaxID=1802286 RepID=A0A1G2LRV1_9BACT|nr:MAG: hypothetical protein A3G49_01965 [Candidatus Sungbacteria bacterium RIFCSPLOWO2_12_FULL_41_11]
MTFENEGFMRYLLKFFFFKIWPKIPYHTSMTRIAAKKFSAGKGIEDALLLGKNLNTEGFHCLFNYAGDHGDSPEIRDKSIRVYGKLIDGIREQKILAGISVKLGQIGLFNQNFHRGKTRSMFFSLVEKMYESGVPLWIDEEEDKYKEKTNEIISEIGGRHPVGNVLQAYLRKIFDKVNKRGEVKNRPIFRICKGAYSESADIILKRTSAVRILFKELVQALSQKGYYLQIATHDKKLVNWVIELEKTGYISRNNFEFAMLYGVDMELARHLLKMGYKVVIYVIFGEDKDIEGYVVRRIIEKPKYVFLPILTVFKAFH